MQNDYTQEGCKYVYECPDRTVQERGSFKILLDKHEEKHKSKPNRTHYIRNNRIESSDTDSNSSVGGVVKSNSVFITLGTEFFIFIFRQSGSRFFKVLTYLNLHI